MAEIRPLAPVRPRFEDDDVTKGDPADPEQLNLIRMKQIQSSLFYMPERRKLECCDAAPSSVFHRRISTPDEFLVTRGTHPAKDVDATISRAIDRIIYAAICVTNSINQAYEVAPKSSVKIAFQTS
ncbi:hypothetical protein [Paraburkholderia sp.]|uniref:hypothetical protein n=1 Tax=Paraburkholderia sp. TaxID=1926495 RepID=UPI0039E3C31F